MMMKYNGLRFVKGGRWFLFTCHPLSVMKKEKKCVTRRLFIILCILHEGPQLRNDSTKTLSKNLRRAF